MTKFEQDYKQIANTKLWKLLRQQSTKQGLNEEFLIAVGEICAIGLDLSKDIIRFFPTFTFHDGTHSAHVCDWMFRLLGKHTKALTAQETALLLMAACCHDIGMSVSDAQKQELADPKFDGWKDYFDSHLDDYEEFCRTGRISDRMMRNYVRLHHHERIWKNLRQTCWPDVLCSTGPRWSDLIAVCESHGLDLADSKLESDDDFDPAMCAVLLRLADLLNFDASRTSDALFHHMGLDDPQTAEKVCSAREYLKNKVSCFDPEIKNGVIRYRARFSDPQMEHDIRGYLDWIEEELRLCSKKLTQVNRRWQDLSLPYRISTDRVERVGYSAGDFRMTMDQDRVISLLSGEDLYSEASVFVRELLQNSIDAVLMRVKQDPTFSLEEGRIIIHTWTDDNDDTWFRIRDNGIGMDEHIIQNYFLKVGSSYYTSDEFRAANRHAPDGKGYTPISRFGIGLLSCFMLDPEGTELKVSTKRFTGGARNGIRLDVTGLHGYYYLAHETDRPNYEDSFLEMPSPNRNDRGYRSEPGTTICVRTSPLQLGSAQSFREVLDQYVQFPEIQVEYHSPEEDKVYPTQQELMDAVHALNPNGVVEKYAHPLSDADHEAIRLAYPDKAFLEKPSIVMRYEPVDLLSDSEKVTGVRISCDIQGGTEDVSLYAESIDRETIRISGIQRFYDERDYEDTTIQTVRLTLPAEEQHVWDLCWKRPFSAFKSCHISHNGVMIRSEYWRDPYFIAVNEVSVLLLRDDFLPRLNMARDEIESLPLEAVCCLDRIRGLWFETPGFMYANPLYLATERECREILDRHPDWGYAPIDSAPIDMKYYPDHKRLSPILLQVAAMKRSAGVCLEVEYHDPEECGGYAPPAWTFVKTQEPPNEMTADFPVLMFAGLHSEALSTWNGPLVVYNDSHPYSQWLIRSREQLVKRAPKVYDQLIRTMMLTPNKEEIPRRLKGILKHLRGYRRNCFDIPEDLFGIA